MKPDELLKFKEEVSDPALKKLFDKTPLDEGLCYIDNIELSFLDGRNYGIDSYFKISGLCFENNEVNEFVYVGEDIEFSDFLNEIKEYYFISDSNLKITDELKEFEINTNLRGINSFVSIFSEFKDINNVLNIQFSPIEYEKMRYLFSRTKLIDELVYSDVIYDRIEAAKKGYKLDVLSYDENYLVRATVAEQGYGLDKLIEDKGVDVQNTVLNYLEKIGMDGFPIDDWSSLNQNKCSLPENISKFNNGNCFIIEAYDKDNDMYSTLYASNDYNKTISHAEKLKDKLNDGKLLNHLNREPFDWLEVVNFNKVLWASYGDVTNKKEKLNDQISSAKNKIPKPSNNLCKSKDNFSIECF